MKFATDMPYIAMAVAAAIPLLMLTGCATPAPASDRSAAPPDSTTAAHGNTAQVTYCDFISLQLCRDEGTECVGGDTPVQAQAKLKKRPSAVAPIPSDMGIHGEAYIYIANSGKHIYLEFRNGRLYSAAFDYLAWLNSSQRCGVDT